MLMVLLSRGGVLNKEMYQVIFSVEVLFRHLLVPQSPQLKCEVKASRPTRQVKRGTAAGGWYCEKDW